MGETFWNYFMLLFPDNIPLSTACSLLSELRVPGPASPGNYFPVEGIKFELAIFMQASSPMNIESWLGIRL